MLQATPGGRRATQLYYQYSKDLVIAGVHDSTVLTTGRRALVAWMPIIDALVAGNGDAATVSAAQAALAAAFLAAVRAAGSEALVLALEREALLVDAESLEGLTATEALARIEGFSCEAAPTLESVRCRLADLRRLVREGLAGRARRQLASRVAKGQKQAKQAAAASAKGKGRRAAAKLRRVGRLLRGVERKLGAKRLAKKTPDAVRLVLDGVVAALRADTDTLAQSP